MEDDDDSQPRPDSLLPYDAWAQEAMRGVAVRALQFAGEQGMPGQHHFYVSFRTDQPGVTIPSRLLAQYPEEMTIVLQHQFWDLRVDEKAGFFSVGLSFGGVALVIPFTALTAFADPHAQFGLRFRAAPVEAANSEEPEAAVEDEPEEQPARTVEKPQIVSLDAFRKRRD